MKKFFFLSGLLMFSLVWASPSFAQRRGSAFAAVPVPGQPVTPAAPTPTPVTPQVPGVSRPATPTAPGAKPEEQLRVVADPATNSLIIYGTGQEFQNIKNILRDLDIMPRQVLMDVLVAEVALTDTESLGVAYQIFGGGHTIFGNTFPAQGAVVSPITSSSTALSNLVSALATGFPSGISGIAGRSNAIRAFINALATEGRLRTLASPSVLATDNRPARIQVGSEIPILSGSTSTFIGGTTTQPLTSNAIQYKNTGVILTIIPQVNSQGLVHLQVKQEVSNVGDNSFGNTNSPSFTTRDAETTAVVQDGETLVIGGMISEEKKRNRSGIPYLMDLPVVGRFLGTTSENTTRTELVILITPHVIRNKDEARSVTDDFKSKLSDLRNELERFEGDRAKAKASQLPKPGAVKPDVKPSPPAPAVSIPQAPAPAVPIPQGPTPAPTRAPGVGASMPPANTTSMPAEQVLPTTSVASISQAAAPAPARAPGVSGAPMASANTVSVPPQQVLPAMPVANAKVEPAADIQFQMETSSTARQTAPALQPQETETYATETDSIGTLIDEIETNVSESASTAIPPKAQTVKPSQVWVVQVASFARDKEADLLANKLRGKGWDANVATAEIGGKTFYRVEVGHLASRNEARELQKNLQAAEKIEQSIIASR